MDVADWKILDKRRNFHQATGAIEKKCENFGISRI